MKYHKFNFYRSTYCEFEMQNINFFDNMKAHFQSKSGSYYYYTEEGVFRYSNHWGRVANCRWKIQGIENYKNQNYYVGYANWSDFYPLNTTDKVFYLEVDYKECKASIKRIQEDTESANFLMTSEMAHQKLKSIREVFKGSKWMLYLNKDIEEVKREVIQELILTTNSLKKIKINIKTKKRL
ncbi:hypothetical protein CSC81_13795 [Tenacibaculum discolor]|uniref:Uncharacterized protein n=1 Tax=Tenacibaculum discolor TaxID=361581 RepID=A0A2G1BRF3_9FLAO|nr:MULTISPECIES: hypothetical protein [Tenacibaculum]MDP2540961.1 hypothetical protein [Tenacibaculum discolor]NVK07854.1 hypothetical protein [Tenacibaculum sp.]PHN96429.1 hypothetical protein CSC81_13795 [Tenacibaculum discolor]PHO00103.1 hypothetical protein CSC82_30560 [Rhodobacteraceae bacterium 4F10]